MDIQKIFSGPVFAERLAFLKTSEHWPAERLAAYQLEQLRILLQYCAERIPYYQELFAREHIRPEDAKDLSYLKRIPMLEKKDIQGRYDDFIPRGVNIETLGHRSTGGSTGMPLTVYFDEDFIAKDKANTVYYMGIAGLNPFDFRSLRIYGDKVPEEFVAAGEYWYEKDNKLIMSCYHYAPETLPKYVERIVEYRPDYIHSRASALLPLAEYLCAKQIRLPIRLRAVFLDGEFLNDAQRARIEEGFSTRVYNIFGHTEGCTAAVACEQSTLLHFMPQVGILEVLNAEGREVSAEDEKGELVVTGFNNRMFPLIRYRTFDVGVHTKQPCGCGRHYRLLKGIDGRMQDFVVNASGNLVPLSPAVFNYNDMDWKGIQQFQVLQERAGHLTFRVVREPSVEESKEEMSRRILAAFHKIFNRTFELSLEFVESIPRTRIGKFRYLDQRLNMVDYFNRRS